MVGELVYVHTHANTHGASMLACIRTQTRMHKCMRACTQLRVSRTN